MRALSSLYHIAIAVFALGLLLGLFAVVVYVLADGLLGYFTEIDFDAWLVETTGFDWRAWLDQFLGDSQEP